MTNLSDIVSPGVLTGDDVMKLLKFAKDNAFAIPAVNVTSSSTINAVLEAARTAKSPVMIQLSNGGAAFYAGKGIANKNQEGSILGSIAAAHHVRFMAKHYGIPVILHTDHCAKSLLPWLDGVIAADEEHFEKFGEPLFSSHMIDLSEETLEDNIEITSKYLQRCAKVNVLLEMELGITGGEEDGVDNSGADHEDLYSKPDEVWQVYKALSAITPNFTVAAAFGNVHGVYMPGNVRLQPLKLKEHQAYTKAQLGPECKDPKPIYFVFHGGSGSTAEEISTAVDAGVIKMNIDTDIQWAYWDGIRKFEADNRGYLQGQIGNPKGADKPNKSYYDPRIWIRKGEESMIVRLQDSFKALRSANTWK